MPECAACNYEDTSGNKVHALKKLSGDVLYLCQRCIDICNASVDTKLEHAITLYDSQQVSMEKAAELAGLSRSDFLDELCKSGFSPWQYDAEEVLREARATNA